MAGIGGTRAGAKNSGSHAQQMLFSFGPLEHRLRALEFHRRDSDQPASRTGVEQLLNVGLAFLLALQKEEHVRAEARRLRIPAPAIERKSSTNIAELFVQFTRAAPPLPAAETSCHNLVLLGSRAAHTMRRFARFHSREEI